MRCVEIAARLTVEAGLPPKLKIAGRRSLSSKQQNKAVQDQQEQHQECQEDGRSDRHRLVGNPPDVSLQTRRHVDFKLSWLNKAAEHDPPDGFAMGPEHPGNVRW